MLKNIYLLLEKPYKHKYGVAVQILIYSVIIISTLSIFLETVKDLQKYNHIFALIEDITMFIFSIEFILRVVSSFSQVTYKSLKSKISFFTNPFVIIDLIVLIPYYLSMFGLDFGFLRVLRILRVFKLIRHTKYDEFDNIIIDIIKERKEQFIVVLVVSSILICIASPFMYYLEHEAQPDIFSSIPAALWWTVVTFTTVGYGDMFPITTLGKILATFITVLGITFYAIPGAIFTSSLLDKIQEKKKI